MVSVQSCGIVGLSGIIIDVEADVTPTTSPSFDIVGLPDVAIRESRERIRATLRNRTIVPRKYLDYHIIVNLAPAHVKKSGPLFDLPITMAIAAACHALDADLLDGYLFLGELSLDGTLRSINGALSATVAAKEAGIDKIVVPADNAAEAAVVSGVEVYGASNIMDVIYHVTGHKPIQPTTVDLDALFAEERRYTHDMSDVRGQYAAKRALEVAAAGHHNVIMMGAPGSGKTMLAQRLPSILPDITMNEALETSKVHSVAGLMPAGTSLLCQRPFRSPHHNTSASALTGGGTIPRPGELSLAHNGVLFLDELPEFDRVVLESLRQPLEDMQVTISRVHQALTYPCNILFIASMNPCKCGWYGDSKRKCTCTEQQIQKYLSRISGPLLDRIDIHISVASLDYADMTGQLPESSADVRKRVNAARDVQHERYADAGIHCNAQLSPNLLSTYCTLDSESDDLLRMAFANLGLSARARDRILKVSRTIADLEGSDVIKAAHITEAIRYRSLDRQLNA